MQLQKGYQLQHGKYTIIKILGQGGFGITYLAETVDGRSVAVKEFFMKDACVRESPSMRVIVPSKGAIDEVERYRQKFVREANKLMRLKHPNIIPVYEVFEENGTSYYAMKYMEGGSLRDNVLRFGPMDEPTAKNYILQVASALQYMHSQMHICHYDVKPGNILMGANGKAMLIDFGLSKNYDGSGQQTSSTPVGVSAGYAPIEQYQQSLKEFSPATDVYALGATMFFLLSGKTPPEASIVFEKGIQCPAQMSKNTWEAISMAMIPSRQQRLQTVDDFCRVLQYSTPQVQVKPPKKKCKAWIGVLAGILTVLAVAAVVLILNNKGGYKPADVPPVTQEDDPAESKAEEEETVEVVEQPFATRYVHKTGRRDKASSEVVLDYPVQGPELLVQTIRSYIIEQLAGEAESVSLFNGDRNDGEEVADDYIRQYLDLFTLDDDLKEYDAEMNVEIKKLSETDLFVTYETTDHVYSGGAMHGMETASGVTFRKSDGQKVGTIFKNTYDEKFKEMVINEVTSKYKWSLEDISTFNDQFKYNPLPETKPFLSRDGVELRYQPYEIASYGDGIIEVTLYWWEVKDFLTDDAKALCPTSLE